MLTVLPRAVVFAIAAQAVSQAIPSPLFRSSVDVVRLAVTVRDQKGQFVRDLRARDFDVLDAGRTKPISDFRQEIAGLSVALLFDTSGSMEGRLAPARETASLLLDALYPWSDEAAVFSFDTKLQEIAPFTRGLRELPASMTRIVPFGATSLFDAIAQAAERLPRSDDRRRAVVVFTDGLDNASRLTPVQVSAAASAIDVPVYVVGIVSPLDDPTSDHAALGAQKSAFAGDLANLAAWTGGAAWIASGAPQRRVAARAIVDELRHQYLIAIESGVEPGWHPLTVNMKSKSLTAHARSGYAVGQSRPNVQ